MSQDKKIKIQSSVSAKASPRLKKIQHKATAGLSEAEVIERHVIGEYNGRREDEESETKEG